MPHGDAKDEARPISYLELQLAVFSIVVFLVKLLCLAEASMDVREKSIVRGKQLIHCCDLAAAMVERSQRWRLPPIDYFERCGFKQGVEGSIVTKLCPR